MSKSIDEQIREILFFQSEPMSSNMLADWQVKDATKQIKSLIAQAEKKGYHNGRYDLSKELIPELEKNLTKLREEDNE